MLTHKSNYKMYRLTLEELQNANLPDHGVYFIYLFDNKAKPCNINRLLGIDSSGLLYIGAAARTTLKYRLSAFFNSMNPQRRQNNHSGGCKVLGIASLRSFVDENVLYFEVLDSEDAMEEERIQLSLYRESFGEVPPLNG